MNRWDILEEVSGLKEHIAFANEDYTNQLIWCGTKIGVTC